MTPIPSHATNTIASEMESRQRARHVTWSMDNTHRPTRQFLVQTQPQRFDDGRSVGLVLMEPKTAFCIKTHCFWWILCSVSHLQVLA
jgi:hypothetical protein